MSGTQKMEKKIGVEESQRWRKMSERERKPRQSAPCGRMRAAALCGGTADDISESAGTAGCFSPSGEVRVGPPECETDTKVNAHLLTKLRTSLRDNHYPDALTQINPP